MNYMRRLPKPNRRIRTGINFRPKVSIVSPTATRWAKTAGVAKRGGIPHQVVEGVNFAQVGFSAHQGSREVGSKIGVHERIEERVRIGVPRLDAAGQRAVVLGKGAVGIPPVREERPEHGVSWNRNVGATYNLDSAGLGVFAPFTAGRGVRG